MPYQLLQTLQGHTSAVSAVSKCGETTAILSASNDFSAKSWTYNPHLGYQVASEFTGHAANITCAAFIPASEMYPNGLFVTGGHDKRMIVFTPFENDVVEALWFESAVTSIFVIDDLNLLCALESGMVMLFRLTYHDIHGVLFETIQNYRGHSLPVWSVIHSAGYVITASEECNVLIFEKSESIFKKIALPINELKVPEGVQALVALNNSVEFLTAGNDGSIRRWNASTGLCVQSLQLHQSLILAIAVSSDNSVLTSCAEDETIIWYNAFTDEDFHGEFIDCPQSACSVGILPNNDIVIGSSEGEVYIFSKEKTRKNVPEGCKANDDRIFRSPQSACPVASLPNKDTSEGEVVIFSKAQEKTFENEFELCEDNGHGIFICSQSKCSVTISPNDDIFICSSKGEVLIISKENEPEQCKDNDSNRKHSICFLGVTSVLILPHDDLVMGSSDGKFHILTKAQKKTCKDVPESYGEHIKLLEDLDSDSA